MLGIVNTDLPRSSYSGISPGPNSYREHPEYNDSPNIISPVGGELRVGIGIPMERGV